MPRISISPEWRLLDPRVDLEALGRYLDTVEQQLAHLRDQWRIRLTADLKDASNKDERDWLWHESEVRETLVTRSLRGGFIMSLWASYESGVSEVADFLKDKKGLRLKLSDVRGRDWFDQARKYFDSVLGFPLHPDLDDWNPLRELHSVRIAYAHANGRLGPVQKSVRRRIERAIDAGGGITHELDDRVVDVDGSYLRSSYDLVEHLLKDLIRRALEEADRDAAWTDRQMGIGGPELGPHAPSVASIQVSHEGFRQSFLALPARRRPVPVGPRRV